MSKRSDALEHCAASLMKAWFPSNHKNQDWLDSEDGRQWKEISLLDASVVIEAYKEFEENNETE